MRPSGASWATSSSRCTFLACVAEEQGLYDLGEVAAGIHAKLVRRHPHIFGDATADTPEAVRKTWDAIKREAEGREGIFHDIPEAFPSTLLAQKLQQRAAAVGFDWEHAPEVLAKVKEETAEVEHELAMGGDPDKVAGELGDLLFSVVNLCREAQGRSGAGPARLGPPFPGAGGGGCRRGRRRRAGVRRAWDWTNKKRITKGRRRSRGDDRDPGCLWTADTRFSW